MKISLSAPSFSSETSWPCNFVNSDFISEKLVPFGPGGQKMCGKGRGFFQHAGRQLLEKVASASTTNQEPAVELDKDLLPKLRRIKPQVRDSYPDTVVNELNDVQLMQIAADTCLFLLVALTMLLEDTLGFPSQHLLLACVNSEDKEKWLRSIFFVGNQIPFVMVHMLMESFSFLKGHRDTLSLKEPPSDPLRLALFKFVTGKSQSPDVMHCLRQTILNWTGGGAPGTAVSLYSPFRNSGLGKVTVNSPSVDISSERWLKLIVNILDEYDTLHEQPKASESLHVLVQSTNDVQAPLSQEVNVAPCFDHNLCQRKPWLYFLWKYKKWLTGILIIISAVLLINFAVTMYGSWLL